MNEELKSLFDEDQADRKNNPNPTPDKLKEITSRDFRRRQQTKKLIDEGLLKVPLDYYHAAYIFQHGQTAHDYLKAHEFAKIALDLGYDGAKYIFAATLDRYLINTGKPQKYGTQYIPQNGKTILAPIDPSTTDEERSYYGIKPLIKIPKEWSK